MFQAMKWLDLTLRICLFPVIQILAPNITKMKPVENYLPPPPAAAAARLHEQNYKTTPAHPDRCWNKKKIEWMHSTVVTRLKFGKTGINLFFFFGARNTKEGSVTNNTESVSETSFKLMAEEFIVHWLITNGVRWSHEAALGFCFRW